MANTISLSAQKSSNARKTTKISSPNLIQLDDFLQENWTQTETNNAKLIVDFMQHLMNEHDFDYVMEKFDNALYTQHNRNLPDGVAGVVQNVSGLVKRYPEYGYDVKKIFATGDYVIFHSHVFMKAKHKGNEKKGFIITDTWRLENGQIAEHWDAIQPINGFFRFYMWMTGGQVRNSNGLF